MTGSMDHRLERLRLRLASEDRTVVPADCDALLRANPEDPAVLRVCGEVLERSGDYAGALSLARKAVGHRPRNVRARLRLARCLWRNGLVEEALETAATVERRAGARAGASLRLAAFYEGIGDTGAAFRSQLRAMEQEPDNAGAVAAAARSAAALGENRQAERFYDRALFLDPERLDWLEARSQLKRHEVEDSHIHELGYRLDGLPTDDPRRAPVCYALAKELEDLGHDEPAFGMLEEGARCRRLDPRKPGGEENRDWLAIPDVYDSDWCSKLLPATSPSGEVFIVAQPGSGGRVLRELLAAESDMVDLGRPRLFRHSARRLARTGASGTALFRSMSVVEGAQLGNAYATSSRSISGGARWRIDSDLDHFADLGLARHALPGARFIHLRRHPLDQCLAEFSTLYPRGHAYSYDLDALADSTTAAHRLMGHWRRHLGDLILDVDYEMLRAHPAQTMASIRAFLEGADPPPAGHAPENRERASRSIAEPREVDHRDTVGRWKRFAHQLGPLADRLRANGVPVD